MNYQTKERWNCVAISFNSIAFGFCLALAIVTGQKDLAGGVITGVIGGLNLIPIIIRIMQPLNNNEK